MDNSMGIIKISARDCFSKLMSLVCDEPYTSIGIYYPASLNGIDFTCVHLYNTWDISIPSWLDFFIEEKSYTGNIDLKDITEYHLVEKIIMYPIGDKYSNRFKIFFSKIIAGDYNNHSNMLEWLLYNITDTPNNLKQVTTGYDIINYIIKMLDNPSCSKPSGTMKMIEPNPFNFPIRKNNIVGSKSIDKVNKSDIFLNSLDSLINIFRKIYDNSDIFQTKLIELKYGKKLIDYIKIENDLHRDISKGLPCKKLIEDLNKIRDTVNCDNLKVEDYYNDKREDMRNEMSIFKEDLVKIANSIENGDEPVIIFLDKFVSHYNRMSEILCLDKLELEEIPPTNSIITTDQKVELKIDNRYITINVSNLGRFTKIELREILKSINEISVVDPKYLALQKSIILELSSRVKNDK